jgi:hypothetical protein
MNGDQVTIINIIATYLEAKLAFLLRYCVEGVMQVIGIEKAFQGCLHERIERVDGFIKRDEWEC